MSAKGHLTRSCQIIKPNMAIITMVGTSHIGNFNSSLKNLIRAKSELIGHMQQKGTLFLNTDDLNSRNLIRKNFKGRIIKIGIRNQANYKAANPAYTKGGMKFQVKLDGTNCNFFIPIYGEHNIYNALFAIAVAHTLGFSADQIYKGLISYQRPNSRLKIYSLKNGIRLIDDTFNANPNSVKAALDVLTHISKENNVAVLGSMGELGRYSRKGHAEVGRYAARKTNLNRIYTYGQEARQIARTAAKSGFPLYRIIQTNNRKKLHINLKKDIQPVPPF
jgi:UDP-N-acetylmuramoyl-tripeptide--D-alanyl-D-alanine ligase